MPCTLVSSTSWTAEGTVDLGSLDSFFAQEESTIANHVSQASLEPSSTVMRSVVAPTVGALDEQEADFTTEMTGMALAGLSRLAPPTDFEEARIAGENRRGDLKTRLYIPTTDTPSGTRICCAARSRGRRIRSAVSQTATRT